MPPAQPCYSDAMRSSCRAALLGIGLIAAALGSACSEAPADGDCAKLFSHLVEMEAAKSKASDADKTKHKAAMDNEPRAAFVERCNTDIKAAQVTCSLKAKTLKEVDACDSKG